MAVFSTHTYKEIGLYLRKRTSRKANPVIIFFFLHLLSAMSQIKFPFTSEHLF